MLVGDGFVGIERKRKWNVRWTPDEGPRDAVAALLDFDFGCVPLPLPLGFDFGRPRVAEGETEEEVVVVVVVVVCGAVVKVPG